MMYGHKSENGCSQGHGHGHGRASFHGHGKVLGTTTISERGQVVIPAEAREALNVSGGDKFVVFGDPKGNSVTLVKAEVVNRFAEIFMSKSAKFEEIAQDILSKINDEEEDSEGERQTGAPASESSDSPAVSDIPKG